MSKRRQRPITPEEAESLLGGGSLLDRIARGAPGTEKPTTNERLRENRPGEQTKDSVKTGPGEGNEKRLKVSLYLSTEEINALDAQIIKVRKDTGRSPRRTHLIREAIQTWLEKQ